ncbi:TPA: hypothetical protein ACGZ9C_003132 [Elizabethkingia anophelis]
MSFKDMLFSTVISPVSIITNTSSTPLGFGRSSSLSIRVQPRLFSMSVIDLGLHHVSGLPKVICISLASQGIDFSIPSGGLLVQPFSSIFL